MNCTQCWGEVVENIFPVLGTDCTADANGFLGGEIVAGDHHSLRSHNPYASSGKEKEVGASIIPKDLPSSWLR